MFALIGRVEIKPGQEEATLAMLAANGGALVQGMEGSLGGYWARTLTGDGMQHSFWLFDTEKNARAAEAMFEGLRDLPDAPATFVSVDVCNVVGTAEPHVPELAY
jgi:hypothetical protein